MNLAMPCMLASRKRSPRKGNERHNSFDSSSLAGRIAATQGAATTQWMIIQASAGFQKSQVGSEVARDIRDTNIGASLAVGNIVAGAKRDLYMTAGNTSAAKIDQGVSLV